MNSTGGRPATITTDDIVRVGREIGMRDLSMSAVAARLGVTGAALYRHVDGRWDLERLVGEAVLADLEIVEDPEQALEPHLVSFGMQLFDFVVEHPGIGAYMQQLFPRGQAGRTMLSAEIAALVRRGHNADVAIALTNVVTLLGIGLAVSEERKLPNGQPDGYTPQMQQVLAEFLTDETTGPLHAQLPSIAPRSFVALTLSATIRGLVEVASPGRPLAEVMADLAAFGGVEPVTGPPRQVPEGSPTASGLQQRGA